MPNLTLTDIGREYEGMRSKMESLLHALRWIPLTIVIFGVVQVIIWGLDRQSPFVVLSGRIVPPSYPGGLLKIEGDVRRDVSRPCALKVTHWIEDRVGFRHYLATVEMNPESIRKLEEVSPGKTRFATPIPPQIEPGSAIYHAESQYICNPIHSVLPITIVTRLPFNVEPARPVFQ